MNRKSLLCTALTVVVLSVLGSTSIMSAQAGGGPGTPPGSAPAPMGRGGRGAAGAAPANLGAAMRDMGAMLTAIKAEAADPAKADQAIKDISTLARDVAISKLLTPPEVTKMATAEEKAKAMATFRTMMNGLTRTLLDLEEAVNAKKTDDIKKAIDKLEEMEKAGHKEFKVGA